MNFRNWILQNFPLLEDNFDALTDYELFTKMCSYVLEYSKDNEEMKAKIAEFQTYFDNLDIQEEINNKLDQMVEDGTFDEIINETIFNQIQNDISNLQEYALLSEKPTLFIGDSYANASINYCDIYKQKVGLSNDKYFKYSLGGAGFHATGTGGKTYIDLLNDAVNDMNSTEKNSIKQIIVGTLINDANYSSSMSQMTTGITNFMNIANNNFPNANVYIIACGYRIGIDNGNIRNLLNNVIYTSIQLRNQNYIKEPIYINYSNLWLRNNDWFLEDGIHPNELGQKVIANSLIRALNGDTSIKYRESTTLTIPKENAEDETINLETSIINETLRMGFSSATRLYNITNLTKMTYNEIGTWTNKVLHPSTTQVLDIPINFRCYMSADDDNILSGILRFGQDGKLYIFPYSNRDFTNIVNFTIYPFTSYKSILYI